MYLSLLVLLLLLALGINLHSESRSNEMRVRIQGLNDAALAVRQADTNLLESHVELEHLKRRGHGGHARILDQLEMARKPMLTAMGALQDLMPAGDPGGATLIDLLGIKLELFEEFLLSAVYQMELQLEGMAPKGEEPPSAETIESLERPFRDAFEALFAVDMRHEQSASVRRMLEELVLFSNAVFLHRHGTQEAADRLEQSLRELLEAAQAETAGDGPELSERLEMARSRVSTLVATALGYSFGERTTRSVDLHTDMMADTGLRLSLEIISELELQQARVFARSDAVAARGRLLNIALLLLTLPILLLARHDLNHGIRRPLETLTARIRGYIAGPLHPDDGSPVMRSKELADLADAVRFVAQLRADYEEMGEDLLVLVETGGLVVFGLDSDGMVTFWNQEASRLTGRESLSVISLPFGSLLSERSGRHLREKLTQLRTAGASVTFDVTLEGADGAPRVILLTLKPTAAPRGDGTSIVAIGLDVTELRRVAQDRERLGMAIDQLTVGMILLDSQHRVRYTNQTVLQFDPALGALLREPGAGLDLERVVHALAAADRRGPEALESLQNWFATPSDGESTPYELFIGDQRYMLRSQHIGDDELLTFENVTLEQIQKAQLVQSAKLVSLGEMATGIAHEINQPLNIMRLAASNMLRRLTRIDGIDDDSRQQLEEKIARINDQITRAASIIGQLRTFGRKSSGDKELFEPGTAVQSVLELFGEQLHLENIDLQHSILVGDHSVLGQKVQLEQVMLNLIGNARDALLEAGTVKPRVDVRLTLVDDRIRFEVEDNGPGIAPEVRDHLFEPFVTTKEVGEGTGLGLSVSFGIIRDMGGRLEVRAGDNGGACFYFELPVAS